MNRSKMLVPVVLIASLWLWLAACATPLDAAKTPEQKFYAAQGMYLVVAEQAVLYIQRHDANPRVVAIIRIASREAHIALLAGRKVLTLAGSDSRDQQLVFFAKATRVAVARLTTALQEGQR